MSIKTKFAALALATVTVVGGIAASTQTADAGWHHHRGYGWGGAGVGFAAGALLGAGMAGAYASGPVYVSDCRWVRQYNQFGQYIGRTKVCGY